MNNKLQAKDLINLGLFKSFILYSDVVWQFRLALFRYFFRFLVHCGH